MNALVYMGANELKYTDFELVGSGENEATITVQGTGICGSDLHAFLGHDARRVPPMVLGHEVFGSVTENGTTSNAVINPIISCGTCDYCLAKRDNLCPNRSMIWMNKQGGFADYLHINKKNIIKLSAKVELKIGALAEPVANAVHSLRLIEKSSFKDIKESKILIIGAGSIGLLFGVLLKHKGCQDITICEKNEKRITNIKQIEGVKDISTIQSSQQYDIIIDAVGIEQTRTLAMNHTVAGGVILHIGLGNTLGSIDVRKLTLSEISFLGTYAYTHEDFLEGVKILESGAINNDLDWVEMRSIKDGQKAFDDILSGDVAAAKIVLVN